MNNKSLTVGLIGYGAIGQEVARLIAEQASEKITLVGVLVHHPLHHPSHQHPPGSSILPTREELLAKQPLVVVEAAGHEGLREHGAAILRAGIDLFIISIGALAEATLMGELIDAAWEGHSQMRIVSGAIGALDALAAASVTGELNKVVHIMRKPASQLLAHKDVATLVEEQVVFRGSARQAAIQFPDFLNVAAAVALASKGFDQTEVRVIADPTITRTRHAVLAEGSFGRLYFEIENAPIPSLGRSAQLVAMSILHTLLLRHTPLAIG